MPQLGALHRRYERIGAQQLLSRSIIGETHSLFASVLQLFYEKHISPD